MPPRCVACGATAAAHTRPPATVTAAGLLPVLDRFEPSRRRRVDARDRSVLAARHPYRPVAAATAVGSLPTRTVPVTAFVAGSIRETVPSWRLTTQTAPSPIATALGPLPTWIGCTTCPCAARCG